MPISHYKSFFLFSHFHIIIEYLPWLQNDANMQKRKNPEIQFFFNQEKQWKNDVKMQKHENMCSV